MKIILKYKKEVLFAFFITFLYFSLRLYKILSLPIFTDEAIYIRWAQIALQDSSWRFISLTDGKQPLFVWFAMFFIKFIKDPLLAGRLVSVMSGFFTLVGLWCLTYELFKNKRIAFLTTILYIFYPFAQVLDRMALYDSMVGAFSVWALYISILLVKKIRLDIAYTLGFIIGAGILTKTSNFFSIYLLPATALLFDYKKTRFLRRFLNWIFLIVFSSIIGLGFYNILRLSPLYQMIVVKNATFVYPFSEWFFQPFAFFDSNINGLFSWMVQYLTFFYIILILISVILINKYFKEKILLIINFIFPFFALALFGKLLYPRFIFFMTLFLLPLAAWGLDFLITFIEQKIKLRIPKYVYTTVLTISFILYSAFVSFEFAKDPMNAKIANQDSSQYVSSWAAGWGVSESVKFFNQKAQNQKIFIATEGTFGLMPEAMEIYLVKNKNIKIKGYWPVDIFPKEVINISKKQLTYFIFYQPQHVIMPNDFPLKLIFEVKQGRSDSYYRVYQVNPR